MRASSSRTSGQARRKDTQHRSRPCRDNEKQRVGLCRSEDSLTLSTFHALFSSFQTTTQNSVLFRGKFSHFSRNQPRIRGRLRTTTNPGARDFTERTQGIRGGRSHATVRLSAVVFSSQTFNHKTGPGKKTRHTNSERDQLLPSRLRSQRKMCYDEEKLWLGPATAALSFTSLSLSLSRERLIKERAEKSQQALEVFLSPTPVHHAHTCEKGRTNV